MARVLAISSYVASGHVGLAAVVPALQRLGHEVIALPSIVLSNHLGHAHWAGSPVAVDELSAMLEALERNGELAGVDAVLTGFLPSPEHVDLAVRTVLRVRELRGDIPYLCDPILGDEPGGLYIEAAAAKAVAGKLAPLATYLTPNRFEAEFIFGRGSSGGDLVDPLSMPKGCRMLALTSAELRGGDLISRCVTAEGSCVCVVSHRAEVPHGTGDLFAALLLGHILNGKAEQEAFRRAVAGVDVVLAASEGRSELALVAAIEAAVNAEPGPFLPPK